MTDETPTTREEETAESLRQAGLTLYRWGSHAEAAERLEKALELDPDDRESLLHLGLAELDMGQPERALPRFDRLLAMDPGSGIAAGGRAAALVGLGRHIEAIGAYDRMLAEMPESAIGYRNRGVALLDLGRAEEAARDLETAVSLAPAWPQAYYDLTECRRIAVDEPCVDAMQRLLGRASALGVDDRVYLHFALGRVFADAGDMQRAFGHLAAGNRLKRGALEHDEPGALANMDGMRAAFPAEIVEAAAGLGDPSELPVFIVGMPRSGTTLVEQILASHPAVHGGGEIAWLHKLIPAIGAEPQAEPTTPEEAQALWSRQLRRIARGYLDRIEPLAAGAARFTDKTVDNFRVLGLIHLALPRARIIHVHRDPLDTCVSCFSKLFVDLPYAFDLAELGRFCRAYERVMAHWRAVLPTEVFIDVRYEDVVADLEGQARRLIAHIGLEWDPRCLEFHRTERPIQTASKTQVREPIFDRSIGRWRAYAPYLGPLIEALGPELAAPAFPKP